MFPLYKHSFVFNGGYFYGFMNGILWLGRALRANVMFKLIAEL